MSGPRRPRENHHDGLCSRRFAPEKSRRFSLVPAKGVARERHIFSVHARAAPARVAWAKYQDAPPREPGLSRSRCNRDARDHPAAKTGIPHGNFQRQGVHCAHGHTFRYFPSQTASPRGPTAATQKLHFEIFFKSGTNAATPSPPTADCSRSSPASAGSQTNSRTEWASACRREP